MSFTGFGADELQGASLKNASPTRAKGQRLKAKKTSYFDDEDDPVADMIPDERPAPITDKTIKRAQKQKVASQQRKNSKSENKVQKVQKVQKVEKSVSKKEEVVEDVSDGTEV